MERITMSLDETLARAFDELIGERGYANRSEAMRDLLRREIETARQKREAGAWCVANLAPRPPAPGAAKLVRLCIQKRCPHVRR